MRCCYWHEERRKHYATASPYSTLRLIVSSQEPITLPSSLCFSFTIKLFLEQGLYFKTALKSFITSNVPVKSSAFSFYWLFGVFSELEKSVFWNETHVKSVTVKRGLGALERLLALALPNNSIQYNSIIWMTADQAWGLNIAPLLFLNTNSTILNELVQALMSIKNLL